MSATLQSQFYLSYSFNTGISFTIKLVHLSYVVVRLAGYAEPIGPGYLCSSPVQRMRHLPNILSFFSFSFLAVNFFFIFLMVKFVLSSKNPLLAPALASFLHLESTTTLLHSAYRDNVTSKRHLPIGSTGLSLDFLSFPRGRTRPLISLPHLPKT